MKWWMLLALAGRLSADAGVLIPTTRQDPDPKVLALAEMTIDVSINDGMARVRIQQIFSNRTGAVQEGNYVFALPGRSMVSDFAVWDDVTRIPGVILERRRAEEIYQNLKMQAIDPGLLQQGERDADEARRGAVFSARIVPIPAYGAKRLEMEYHEPLNVEDLRSMLAVPLKPDVYRTQIAGRLSIRFEVRSKLPLKEFAVVSKAYPVKIEEQSANVVRASYSGVNVSLTEDFGVRYGLDGSKGERLEVLTSRDPEVPGPGYFQATLMTVPQAAAAGEPRTVVALFDTSLSVQWEKLERSFQALEGLLRGLRPADRFNVLLFHSQVTHFAPAPVEADPAAVEKALAFVKASRLRGGTNLQAALEAGLAQKGPDPYLVLIGDGNANRGLIQNGKLAEWYAAKWQSAKPRTFVFAIGDDANESLLKVLARQGGVMTWVRSTEAIEFKLQAFLNKIGKHPVENLRLTVDPAANVDVVYPLHEAVFPGALASWVGQYPRPGGQTTFRAGAQRVTVALPARDLDHPQLPRTWAKARVDALLEKIDREGEDTATIDEIIRLSRQYKFVTPYTSFLAAPRSLLRPRLIRPGDPVLRVRADESVVAVTAMFPFGLVKELRFLKEEDIWQTRFLAPKDMADGTYSVRLLLRDRQGRVFRESKTFVIASKPPVVKVHLDRAQYRRGETVALRVSASETTRTVTARLYGAAPVHLRWNPEMRSNTGALVIPAHLAAGKYTLTVQAEDLAHNIGSHEASIEVLP